jgi:hypothetical protein
MAASAKKSGFAQRRKDRKGTYKEFASGISFERQALFRVRAFRQRKTIILEKQP